MIDTKEKSKKRDNHIFRHAPEQYSRFALTHTSLTLLLAREEKLKNAAKCENLYMYLVLPPSELSENKNQAKYEKETPIERLDHSHPIITFFVCLRDIQ